MSFSWDKEELITIEKKNKNDNILVKKTTLKDKDYIDIRIAKIIGENENQPTSAGVAIPLEVWKEIVKKVDEKLKLD